MAHKSPHSSHNLRNQRGFGLIELSISLVLIAGLLLGGFYIVRNIRADTLRKQYSESAVRSLSTASKYLATYRSAANISTDMLIDMGGWQQDKKIVNPGDKTQFAARSIIPGAWEDVDTNTKVVGSKKYTIAYAKEGVIYRISKVPKANCSWVIGELARYPSVGLVSAKAWTNDEAHPGDMAGTAVAQGTNINTSENANVVLDAGEISTVCKNAFVNIFALVVRD